MSRFSSNTTNANITAAFTTINKAKDSTSSVPSSLLPLLPSTTTDFHSKAYWDNFFKERGSKPFEWYGEYLNFSHLIYQYAPSYQESFLVIGCGNSEFSSMLYDAKYTNITNIDFSPIVINEMTIKNKVKRPHMKWLVSDMTDLKDVVLDNSFNNVFDKGALDALFSEDTIELRLLAKNMFTEIVRVLFTPSSSSSSSSLSSSSPSSSSVSTSASTGTTTCIKYANNNNSDNNANSNNMDTKKNMNTNMNDMNGGKYMCITLAQDFIIKALLTYFTHSSLSSWYSITIEVITNSRSSPKIPFFVCISKLENKVNDSNNNSNASNSNDNINNSNNSTSNNSNNVSNNNNKNNTTTTTTTTTIATSHVSNSLRMATAVAKKGLIGVKFNSFGNTIKTINYIDVQETLKLIKAVQEFHDQIYGLGDIQTDRFESMDFWCDNNTDRHHGSGNSSKHGVTTTSVPRFTITILDTDKRPNTRTCAVFIIPVGRESEYQFNTKNGLHDIAIQAECNRLFAVRINKPHTYLHITCLQEELSPIIVTLIPCRGNFIAFDPQKESIPYMSLADENEWKEVKFGFTLVSGDYIIEEKPADNDDDDDDVQGLMKKGSVIRRLIFLQNQNFVQTECRLLLKQTNNSNTNTTNNNSNSLTEHASADEDDDDDDDVMNTTAVNVMTKSKLKRLKKKKSDMKKLHNNDTIISDNNTSNNNGGNNSNNDDDGSSNTNYGNQNGRAVIENEEMNHQIPSSSSLLSSSSSSSSSPYKFDLTYVDDHHCAMLASFSLLLASSTHTTPSTHSTAQQSVPPWHGVLIGLGGGSLPMCLQHYFPNTCLTIVELDDQIEFIATEFFGFEKLSSVQGSGVSSGSGSGKTEVIVQDGVEFIANYANRVKMNSSSNSYDIDSNNINNSNNNECSSSSNSSSSNNTNSSSNNINGGNIGSVIVSHNHSINDDDDDDELSKNIQSINITTTTTDTYSSKTVPPQPPLLSTSIPAQHYHHQQPLLSYMIIDVDGKDNSLGLTAPPLSFIHPSVLTQMYTCLAPGGLLILNVVARGGDEPIHALIQQVKLIFGCHDNNDNDNDISNNGNNKLNKDNNKINSTFDTNNSNNNNSRSNRSNNPSAVYLIRPSEATVNVVLVAVREGAGVITSSSCSSDSSGSNSAADNTICTITNSNDGTTKSSSSNTNSSSNDNNKTDDDDDEEEEDEIDEQTNNASASTTTTTNTTNSSTNTTNSNTTTTPTTTNSNTDTTTTTTNSNTDTASMINKKKRNKKKRSKKKNNSNNTNSNSNNSNNNNSNNSNCTNFTNDSTSENSSNSNINNNNNNNNSRGNNNNDYDYKYIFQQFLIQHHHYHHHQQHHQLKQHGNNKRNSNNTNNSTITTTNAKIHYPLHLLSYIDNFEKF